MSLLSLSQLVHAQDTIVLLSGQRILGWQTTVGKFAVRYSDAADSSGKKTGVKRVYFIRYADGRTWPPAIGKSRQRTYEKNVVALTGDTALARDKFPLRSSGSDTLTPFHGNRITASGTTLHKMKTRYVDAATGELLKIPTAKLYRVRFADGHVWPPESSVRRDRIYAEEEAKRTGNWDNYVKKFASSRHQILICTPSFHQTGEFPGISIGLSYYAAVDSAARFSVGATFGKMWSGTWETGELDEGDRRANIHALYAVPTLRYHLLDRRSVADPFVGIGAALGSYRRYDVWINRGRQYTELPTVYFMFSPQVELGIDINSGRHFSMQILAAGGPQFIGGRSDGLFGTLGLIRMGVRF